MARHGGNGYGNESKREPHAQCEHVVGRGFPFTTLDSGGITMIDQDSGWSGDVGLTTLDPRPSEPRLRREAWVRIDVLRVAAVSPVAVFRPRTFPGLRPNGGRR